MISNDGMVFVSGRLWPSYKPEGYIHSGKNALKNALEDSVGHSLGSSVTGGGITGTGGTGEKGSGVKPTVKSVVGRKGGQRPVQRHSTRSINRINRTITFGLGGGTRDARNHIPSASAASAPASSTSTSSSTGTTSSIMSSSATASAGVSSTVSLKVSKNTAAEAAALLGAASVSLVPRKVRGRRRVITYYLVCTTQGARDER